MNNTTIETTPIRTDGETRRDWITPSGIRARESFIPARRPDFKKWVRLMGITPLGHQVDPLGDRRAREITGSMGAQLPETVFEQVFPRQLW